MTTLKQILEKKYTQDPYELRVIQNHVKEWLQEKLHDNQNAEIRTLKTKYRKQVIKELLEELN